MRTALLAPPPEIAVKVNAEVDRALKSQDMIERLAKLGTHLGRQPMRMTIPEFTQFVRREVEDTGKVPRAEGIKPQ